MARRLPEELENSDLVPLAVASNLSEAEQIESVLDAAGIDYTFDVTPLGRGSILGVLFGSVKNGVMFLIPSGDHPRGAGLLDDAGLRKLLVG